MGAGMTARVGSRSMAESPGWVKEDQVQKAVDKAGDMVNARSGED